MPEPVEDLGHLPLASKVEALAGFGLTTAEIARVLDIDEELLGSTFAKQLDSGALKANARVAESLYRKALGEGREAVTAAIFWLKTRARWKETSLHEHAGAGGKPIQIDFSTWSDQQLDQAIARLEASCRGV